MGGGQTLAQDHKKMRKNVRKRGEIKGKEGVKLRYREQEKAMRAACVSVVPSERMVSSSSIDFLSVSPTGSNFLRFPLQSERMGFNKDLSRHPLTVTALQPPSQTSVVELKAPANSHTLAPLR